MTITKEMEKIKQIDFNELPTLQNAIEMCKKLRKSLIQLWDLYEKEIFNRISREVSN